MKFSNLFFEKSCFFLVLLIVLGGLSGCNEEKAVQTWIENASKLRADAKQQSDIIPYRKEQFMALKAYFTEINEMALKLKSDVHFAQQFNLAVPKTDLEETCAKVFIPKPEWELMMDRCSRNRFFLCAEEVRAYRDMVLTIRGSLLLDQQMRFDQTDTCQAAL